MVAKNILIVSTGPCDRCNETGRIPLALDMSGATEIRCSSCRGTGRRMYQTHVYGDRVESVEATNMHVHAPDAPELVVA